ncbi:MAG: hypothetical protein M1829_001824 [Trizodia sp. TS-e1964]|nr:MAG: hypothetical protein M1829_001824 [Trizodia sp. TS-e1964]
MVQIDHSGGSSETTLSPEDAYRKYNLAVDSRNAFYDKNPRPTTISAQLSAQVLAFVPAIDEAEKLFLVACEDVATAEGNNMNDRVHWLAILLQIQITKVAAQSKELMEIKAGEANPTRNTQLENAVILTQSSLDGWT